MAFSHASARFWSGGTYIENLTILADAIVAASPNWSYSGITTYNSTAYGVILTHTDTAQLMFVTGTSNVCTAATNGYQAAGRASGNTHACYKPPSGLSFAPLTDAVNPLDTATYCSAAGAYNFQLIMWRATATSEDVFTSYNGTLHVVADTAKSALWCFYDNQGTRTEPICYHATFCTPDGIVPDDPTDTYLSMFCHVNWGSSFRDMPNGTNTEGLKLSFFDSAGVRLETGRLRARDEDIRRDTDLVVPAGYQRESVEVSQQGWGRKGAIDLSLMSTVRPDARDNVVMECGGNQYLHVRNGITIPWEGDLPLH